MAYYENRRGFHLFERPGVPSWRSPQLGALGAVSAHWTLHDAEPALISLPTGVGKTAIALSAPYLAQARRILVVVPSAELRRQMANQFATEDVLLRIGALEPSSTPTLPRVREITGIISNWEELEDVDVVVGLPNSLSPVHYPDKPPPTMFDPLIIDEAHHLPAKTWRAILDHFTSDRCLLLTATPVRRDGKRVPGEIVYRYPLRQALCEGLYKPVHPRILEPTGPVSQDMFDRLVADECCEILRQPEHATSSLLVRARTRQRAKELAALYQERGLNIPVLHAGLSPAQQKALTAQLRQGNVRGVAVVGMLIEGFDLPSLRVLAYHDKHKSLPATTQLIGRLARMDSQYPQQSVLVPVRDIDIYPELQGIVRELYSEDNDWAEILPGIIDAEIAEDIINRDYARRFSPPDPILALEAIHPLHRALIFESPLHSRWVPSFVNGEVPVALQGGENLAGETIVYSGINTDRNGLMIVTASMYRPAWHNDPGLDAVIHNLHIVNFRRAPRTDYPDLFLINSDNMTVVRVLLRLFDPDERLQRADPNTLQQAFDSLPRVSASNVGVRNTYGKIRGTPSYKMFSGSSIERGMRDGDTAQTALGHAMIQVSHGGPAFTAGVSTGKSKYWETRYSPLRIYDEFVTDLCERYWFPPVPPSGPLLPSVTRGRRLEAWSTSRPFLVELDSALLGAGWDVENAVPLSSIEFQVDVASAGTDKDRLPLIGVMIDENMTKVLWRGYQDLHGVVHTDGEDLSARRGFGLPKPLSELLTVRPLTIYFPNGLIVRGNECFDSRPRGGLPLTELRPHAWMATNIQAETPTTAQHHSLGHSVQEELEQYLSSRPRTAKRRWIICNDGPREIADYIVVEVGKPSDVSVQLWHAKAAGGQNPAVRVSDLEEAIAQAMKSRRWITDPEFWRELGKRLVGKSSPRARMVEGNLQVLLVLCGESKRWHDLAFTYRRPIVRGEIWVVQPGLSRSQFIKEFTSTPPTLGANQVRELLTIFHDSVANLTQMSGLLCSE